MTMMNVLPLILDSYKILLLPSTHLILLRVHRIHKCRHRVATCLQGSTWTMCCLLADLCSRHYNKIVRHATIVKRLRVVFKHVESANACSFVPENVRSSNHLSIFISRPLLLIVCHGRSFSSMPFSSQRQQQQQRSSSGGSVVSRERLRDRERLAGCGNQVDSETCDERKESASERLRASQCSITATTRYRCVELEVMFNAG